MHQIITVAQKSANVETLPFRAIFAAYDQVLAQNGLDPDHDQIYLRFLFRLGNQRGRGQSLFEAFEALLADLGIRIQFGDDDVATQDLQEGRRLPDQQFQPFHEPGSATRRSRRASFSSFIDADEENTRASRQRTSSRASLSRLQYSPAVRQKSGPSTRATNRATERPQRSDRLQHKVAESPTNTPLPRRSRLRDQEPEHNALHLRHGHVSTSSQDSRKGIPRYPNMGLLPSARRRGDLSQPQGHLVPASDGGSTSDNTIASLGSRPSDSVQEASRHELLYRPSKTQLVRDSELFQSFRIRSIARNIIQLWRERAVDARRAHVVMWQKAVACDTDTLLRQAFDQWRDMHLAKQQALQTERFFSHLEHRAGRARDLYLLTKAFTHWAECASEEVQRTFAARRHLLRTKYFNAWLDITAVNNLKLRRQSLRKFFYLWQHNLLFVTANRTIAISLRKEKLVKTTFWSWFWNFCDQRAPEWRNARQKKRLLARWLAITSADAKVNVQIILSYEETIVKRCLTRWRAKTRALLASRRHADNYYSRKLLKANLVSWRLNLQHLPLARHVHSIVDWRVASSTFSTLRLRLAFERQAEQVNEQRIIRTSWTQWNDRLRWQTLSEHIGNRLVLQALYKWALVERSRLLRRLCAERLQQRALNSFVNGWKSVVLRQADRCGIIANARNRQLQHELVRLWHSKSQATHQQGRTAFDFHTPRIEHKTLQVWRSKYENGAKLNKWADEAAFYFRASRTIKSLKETFLERQKQKRRDAYVYVRRQVKMDQARRTLERWYNRAAQVIALQWQAEQLDNQRLLASRKSLFNEWQERSYDISRHNIETGRQSRAKLVNTSLQRWSHQFRVQQDNEDRASDFATSHVEKTAYDCLRSLRIKALELNSRAEAAIALGQWNKKRQSRNLLRRWREKILQRRGLVELDSARPIKSRRTAYEEPATVGDGTILPSGEMTEAKDEFDLAEWIPALEAQSNSTPLPGYLSTPSKRAARARALTRAPVTPSTSNVFASPLLRRMRVYPATDSRPARRSNLGRVELVSSVGGLRAPGFHHIPEDEQSSRGYHE